MTIDNLKVNTKRAKIKRVFDVLKQHKSPKVCVKKILCALLHNHKFGNMQLYFVHISERHATASSGHS